jgi:hypothetical protein
MSGRDARAEREAGPVGTILLAIETLEYWAYAAAAWPAVSLDGSDVFLLVSVRVGVAVQTHFEVV